MSSQKKETQEGIEWSFEGELHKDDGPALEYKDGRKFWIVHGIRHREDGPACEYPDGSKEWYVNGKNLTQEEYNHWLEKKNLKDKLEEKFPDKLKQKRMKL